MTMVSIRCHYLWVLAVASACSVRDGVLGTVVSGGSGGSNGSDTNRGPLVADASLGVADSSLVVPDGDVAVPVSGGDGDGDNDGEDASVDIDSANDDVDVPDSSATFPDSSVVFTDVAVADTSTPVATCLSSPVVSVSRTPTCVNRLAASTFTNALCTCGDLRLSDYLITRGFDSTLGPYRPWASDGGAGVGVNGNYPVRATAIDVRGSFSVAGFGTLQLANDLQVFGDLYAAGNVSVTGSTDVWRNAWLGGLFTGLGHFTVGGELHHASNVNAQPLSTASSMRELVSVAQPCPCSLLNILDIPTLVDAARTKNDNGLYGIDQNAFARIGQDSEWTVSCGQVFLSQIGGTGDLVVHVTGLAALFIDGSITLNGDLSFDVAPGAEIDVFVKGNVALQGALAVANKDRPAAGRLWVWGALPITLRSPWIGNLYAPHASIRATEGLEAWGALFAFDFTGSEYASVVFDRAILEPAACSAPSPPAGLCTRCQWCNSGTACVGGTCGACQRDSDCCSLSVCTAEGVCEPLVGPTRN